MIANLGEETYTELVGMTALATTVDTLQLGPVLIAITAEENRSG